MRQTLFSSFAAEDFEEGDAPEAGVELTEVELPENDVLDAQEAEAGAEETTAAVDEATQTVGTLTDMSDSLQEAADSDDGITEPEADAVAVAVEHLCARLGMPKRARPVIATEAFNTGSSKAQRKKALKAALENIGEGLKKIWDAIVETCTKAWNWIKQFVTGLFDGAQKYKARAAQIKAAAEKADATSGDITVSGSAFQVLRMGGQMPDAAKLVELAKADQAAFKTTEDSANQLDEALVKTFEKAANDAKGDKEGGLNSLLSVSNTITGMAVGEVSKSSKYKAPNDQMVVMEGQLPGTDYALYATVIKDTVSDGKVVIEHAGSIRLDFDLATSAGEAKAPEKYPALSKDQVVELATAVEADMAGFEKFKAGMAKNEANMKRLIETYKKIGKEATGDDNQAFFKGAAKLAGALNRFITASNTKSRKFHIQRAAAKLEIASASLATAKGGAKPEEKKEEPKQDEAKK